MAESSSALQHQPTTGSLLSWWSDSNPPGATIPLHTLTKPLLKYMYHRQALDLIKKDEDLPISPEKLETLTTYLTFKYISTATRVVVLGHISEKASRSEGEARILLDGGILSRISELLKSPDELILLSTTGLLRTIVCHGALINTVVESNMCPELIRLLSSKYVGVQERVICILAQISSGQDNAVSAIARANFLSHVTRFLESHNHITLGATCWIVGKMAQQGAQYGDLVTLGIFRRLVALLELPRPREFNPIVPSSASLLWVMANPGDLFIQRNATHALADASSVSVEGAREVIDANVLGHAGNLLESLDHHVLGYTCLLLGNLSRHKSLRLMMAIDGADFRESLASLLHHKVDGVRTGALYALGHMSQWSLDTDLSTRFRECRRLRDPSRFLDTPMARWMAGDAYDDHHGIRDLEHCIIVVACLEHEDEVVRASARDALHRIRIGSDTGAIMVEAATALWVSGSAVLAMEVVRSSQRLLRVCRIGILM